MELTHVIFDLDGTLLETLPSLVKCGNRVLDRLGLEVQPAEDYRFHVGYGARELVRRLLLASAGKDPSQDELDRALALYLELFQEDCTYQVRPYPGIPELLGQLTAAGIRLAVLTNKPHAMTRRVMAEAFPESPFDFIQGQTADLPRKPDPQAAFAVAQRIGAADFSRVGFIGDSDADMQTAVRAGMVPIGVAWGFRSADELIRNGAQLILKHPSDLTAALNEKQDVK